MRSAWVASAFFVAAVVFLVAFVAAGIALVFVGIAVLAWLVKVVIRRSGRSRGQPARRGAGYGPQLAVGPSVLPLQSTVQRVMANERRRLADMTLKNHVEEVTQQQVGFLLKKIEAGLKQDNSPAVWEAARDALGSALSAEAEAMDTSAVREPHGTTNQRLAATTRRRDEVLADLRELRAVGWTMSP